MLKMRPDIGYAVSRAATRSTIQDTIDWLELKTILHYLYNTWTYGLVLKRIPKGSKLTLVTSVDASYLTHKNSHSCCGWLFHTHRTGEKNRNFCIYCTLMTNFVIS